MKRMNKNAVALATAGALTLAVAPAAMAQDETDINKLGGNGETFVTPTDSPAPRPSGMTEGKGPTITEGTQIKSTFVGTPTETPKSTPRAVAPTAPLKNAKCNSVIYYRHADGLNYVTDPNRTTGALPGTGVKSYQDILNDKDCSFIEDSNNVQGPVEPGEAAGPSAGDIAKAVAALAGAAVGTGIIINGVKYFVNKDKKTLVQDPNRVNAEPSAEEKAKSEEVVKANPDAVASQTGAGNAEAGANNAAAPAANGERGIGASTGVNKLPAGILSLLLASLLGAAAFVFGRRQLV